MHEEHTYITIGHLAEFGGLSAINVNDSLILKKDLSNPYDDEAIAVYDLNGVKVGYVNNSVRSVARGTRSAGRIYDSFRAETGCRVLFMIDEIAIAEVSDL